MKNCRVIGAFLVLLLFGLAACGASAPPPTSHGGPVEDYVSLIDHLCAAGATVVPNGKVKQPFFSVAGQVITLNGEQVQVGERLLDVGCGTATFLIAAKSRYPDSHVVSIDADDRVLAIARKKIQDNNLEVEVVQARAEQLPFPSSSFDVVVSTVSEKNSKYAITLISDGKPPGTNCCARYS